MTHVQKLQAYTCLRRFHVFVYYHYPDGTIHVFFALNQWVLDSKLANEWHEKFSFCESMRQQFLCRIFHVLKYKWSSFLASFFSSSPSFSYSFTIPNKTNHVFLHANLRMYCEMKRMITSWIKEWSWLFPFTLWRWIVHVLYAHEVIVTQILIQFLKLENISCHKKISYHVKSDYIEMIKMQT